MKPTLQLARELVHGLWEEAAQLLATGWEAYEPFPDLPMEVDRKLYETLEDLGKLRVYTARRRGELQGYAVFIIGASPRRRYLVQAQQDVIHAADPSVTPALIRYSERALRDDNVQLIYHSTPIKGSRFGKLLEILGYGQIGQVYAKLLR